MEQEPKRSAERAPVVGLGSWVTWFLGLYFLALLGFLFYVLIILWPCAQAAAQTQPAPPELVILRLTIPPALQLMLLAMVMGALGSCVHTISSFVRFVGNRRLVKSWVWWYVLWPFVGMTLAVIVYFVIRGGLLTFGSMPKDFNVYGIAGISALVGMFAKQATEKLREIMDAALGVKKEHEVLLEDKADDKNGDST